MAIVLFSLIACCVRVRTKSASVPHKYFVLFHHSLHQPENVPTNGSHSFYFYIIISYFVIRIFLVINMNKQQERDTEMNSLSIPDLETLIRILSEHGQCRWKDCIFVSAKKHQNAVFPVRLEVKSSHTRILVAARTFEQAAEGVTYLYQLPHKSNNRMDVLRHCDWSKQETLQEEHNFDDEEEESEDSWSGAFSIPQLLTILTSHPHRAVGFHQFTFSVEQSMVVVQHAVRIAFHNCGFTDGGNAFLQVFQGAHATPLRALTLHQLPWDVNVWKQLLPCLRVEELTLECIAIDAEDSAFLGSVPIQLSLLQCQFSDRAQSLCQALAHTGGPQIVHLEDDAHAQAQSCWSNLLVCAVQDCSNVKTLGVHLPVTWNATNHLPLVMQYLRGNVKLERLILRNVQHPQQWSETLHILSHQTSLKHIDLIDCPREYTDVMVGHLLNVLTHNRRIQVQLQGKGEYWHRIQHKQIEPRLLYNRLHCFSQQCQQTNDQHHRMTLLSSALAKTTQQQVPERTHLLLSTNLDALIAYMQR